MKKSPPKQKKKEATIDELARMMASSFSDMGSRFDGVHDQIDELDERLSGHARILDEKIGIVNTNVLSLQYDYRKVIARIENLEMKAFGPVQEP